MLCLSGFELSSRWVLLRLVNTVTEGMCPYYKVNPMCNVIKVNKTPSVGTKYQKKTDIKI